MRLAPVNYLQHYCGMREKVRIKHRFCVNVSGKAILPSPLVNGATNHVMRSPPAAMW